MITIDIPQGKTSIDIDKELMSARNIKDKNNRKKTIEGLNKIRQYL